MSLLENNPVRRINGSGFFFGYDPMNLDMENSWKFHENLKDLQTWDYEAGIIQGLFFVP